MKKNKKSQAGIMPFGHIVKWIILFALLLFVLFWFSGLGDKMIKIVKSLF
tara:strand:+ start:791 stop:940 length:150 start_codon:yes stop_codon:yes gene_type:complete